MSQGIQAGAYVECQNFSFVLSECILFNKATIQENYHESLPLKVKGRQTYDPRRSCKQKGRCGAISKRLGLIISLSPG